jgi:hypothetical protein
MANGITAPPPDDGGLYDWRDTTIKYGTSTSSSGSAYQYRTGQGKKKPKPTKVDTSNLKGKERDAAAALIELFESYGLGTLAPQIVNFIKSGYSADTIAILLRDTDEYKRRFAGNITRQKAGLPVLSEAEYLSTERAYAQIMQQYGLPSGFYDSYSDFSDFIARDVSAAELEGRVGVASRWATTATPETARALRDLYGLGSGDLAAYALDPDRALPLLEKQARAVSIASSAYLQGLSQTRGYAERLAGLGVTEEGALTGYAQVAEMLPTFQELGDIYGEEYEQRHAEREVFEGETNAVQKRKGLASQERAAFSGSSRGQVGRRSGGYSY